MDKKYAAAALVILIVLGVIGIGIVAIQQRAAEETVKIGFVGPLTGELANWGQNQKLGLDLALEQANRQGGVNGKRIEIIYEDSQCDPRLSVQSVKKLIELMKFPSL